jgi:hypothetical protein
MADRLLPKDRICLQADILWRSSTVVGMADSSGPFGSKVRSGISRLGKGATCVTPIWVHQFYSRDFGTMWI